MLKSIVLSSIKAYRVPLCLFSAIVLTFVFFHFFFSLARRITFNQEIRLISSLREQEKKIIGIDNSGHLSEKNAMFVRIVAPEKYAQLKQAGVIPNPGKIDRQFAKSSIAFDLATKKQISGTLSHTIDSCGDITQGGNYSLSQDIQSNSSQTCITIYNTSDVHLNCQNHTITTLYDTTSTPAIFFSNVQNFSLSNCTISKNNVPQEYGVYSSAFSITDSQNGIVQNNHFSNTGESGFIKNSTNIETANNSFSGSFGFESSSYMNVHDNNFTPSIPNNFPQAILARNGNHNTVSKNIIDGTYAGGLSPGEDDAINTFNETDDNFSRNTMKNFYDCGFESIGFLNNTEISGNVIENTSHCAIGAWYWSSWQNNTVSGNYGSNVALLFWFFISTWDGESLPQPVYYFQNNTFNNNKLLSQNNDDGFGNPPQFSSSFDFVAIANEPGVEKQIHADNVVTGGNAFALNDFGLNTPLVLVPPSATVDQGNNRCIWGNQVDFPLNCLENIPSK